MTNASPKIELIEVFHQYFRDPDNASTRAKEEPNTSRALIGNPCKNLETVLVKDTVWTVPYLEYLAFKAPNLVHVNLSLKDRDEKNRTKFQSTLEACLRVWSRTLREITIIGERDLFGKDRSSPLLVFFPEMKKLKYLHLKRVQISGASSENLWSLETLSLCGVDHRNIAAALSNSSLLPRLTEVVVDWNKTK